MNHYSAPLSLALCLLFLSTLSRPIYSQSPLKGDWHMENTAAKQVKASLSYHIDTPNMAAREWIVFAAVPPELPSQSNVSASIQGGKIITELSDMKRPVLFVQIPATNGVATTGTPKSVSVRVDYQATLIARKIAVGKPASPAEDLTEEGRNFCLVSSLTCDFKSKEVQAWLDKSSLRRSSTERDLEFAYRVFQHFRTELAYRCDDNQLRSASQVCKDKWSDCGGIANLYVAALRANNVPARVLPGRLAISAEGPSASCHVKSEFFAEGIGWVPVEITSAVAFKKSPAVNFFGVDDGNLLSFHTGTDLILDSKTAGLQSTPTAQWVHYWVDGTGSWKNHTRKVVWNVQTVSVR